MNGSHEYEVPDDVPTSAHGDEPPSKERPAVSPLAPAAGGSSASSGKADVSAAAQSATKLVALSLFIDALLLTIVVPILPYTLPKTGEAEHDEKWKVGILFASKAAVQIMVNPVVGAVVDRVGPKMPMLAGYAIVILSTVLYGITDLYSVLFTARAIQGIGSACLATSGFSLIALVQPDDEARGEAMGNAVGGLALGVLIGPPLGGFLYHIAGKSSDKHHNTTITTTTTTSPKFGAIGSAANFAASSGPNGGDSFNTQYSLHPYDSFSTGGSSNGNGTGGGGAGFTVSGQWLPFAVVAVLTLLVAFYQVLWFSKHTKEISKQVKRQQSLGAATVYDDDGTGASAGAAAGAMDVSTRKDERLPLIGQSKQQECPPQERSLRVLLADREILATLVAYMLANASIGMLEPTLPLWMQDAFDSPSWLSGVLFLAPSFSFLLTAPLIAGWALKVGRARCAVFGMLLIAVSLFFIALPGPRSSPAEAIPGLIGVGVGIGICEATVNPLIASVVEARYPGNFGSAFALSDMAFSFGFIIGPIIGTSVYNIGVVPDPNATAPNYAVSPTIRFGDACLPLAVMLVLYSPIMYWSTAEYDIRRN